jgi:hypothetical protein
MKRKKDEPAPRMPPEDLPNLEALTAVRAEDLIAGTPIEEAHVRDVDLSGRSVQSVVARNCVFDHVSFASCRISSFRLPDVRLIKYDLSGPFCWLGRTASSSWLPTAGIRAAVPLAGCDD